MKEFNTIKIMSSKNTDGLEIIITHSLKIGPRFRLTRIEVL